jgi:transcriptional regulator of acetoin/glycerol metabolism
VLRNVGALDQSNQSSLLRWLDGGQRQVVSTTVHPLFPLVARGLFDEQLYYRLNTMLIRLDSTGGCAA